MICPIPTPIPVNYQGRVIYVPIPLLDAMEEFETTLVGVRDFRDPALALNECGDTSEEFAHLLLSRGIECKLVGCTHFIDKIPGDITAYYHNTPNRLWNHMFVEAYGIYVDWTARQFAPSLPFPYVFEDVTLVKSWGRIERFDP
jgi:hypothetical protein